MIKIEIIENSKIEDPIIWAIRYLIAASAGNLFLSVFRSGIKDSKLISNPIHEVNQEYAEIAIRVPIIIELKNKILNNFIIKKKRSIDLYWWGMNPWALLAYLFM